MKEHSATRGLLPSEIYEKIEEDYERVKDQFLDTKGRSLSWTLLDTYSLAKQAGHDLDIVSVNAYVMPNLHIHASTTDLNRKVPQGDGTYKFDNGPQEQHADSALLSATHLLIVALYLQEDYFQLGIRPQIDAVQLGFANSWSEG